MSRFLRAKEVIEITGIARSTIHALAAVGRFPKPVKISEGGRASGWHEDEIHAWMNGRAGGSKVLSRPAPKTAMPQTQSQAKTIPLRDQFAMSALSGLLANTKLTSQVNDNFAGERANQWFTDAAYDFADSMIKSRSIRGMV